MQIDFRVIAYSEMRYPTCGDYWEEGDVTHYRVAQLSDTKYEWLIFLHEFVENSLRQFAGVPTQEIDDYDIAYEASRQHGIAHCGCQIQEEPGMDKHCPVYWQHRIADIVERTAALALGVDWVAYGREIESLEFKA